MNRRSTTVTRLMVVVALVALDLGLLLNRGLGANPFQIVTLIVLEVGLFRALSEGGGGRAWWIGFAVGALAYVAIDGVFHYEIRYALIDSCHLAVLKPLVVVVLVAVPLPEPLVFALLAATLQVGAALLLGVLGGGLMRRLAGTRRFIQSRGGPDQGACSPGPPTCAAPSRDR